MTEGAKTLAELLGRRVVTESGRSLGRLHDLRGDLGEGRLQVTGLVAGPAGVLERLGVRHADPGGPDLAKRHRHDVIPWGRVVRIGPEIVVRD